MRVKYIGKNNPLSLLYDKLYDVMGVEQGWYRILDESGEDYLYPPELFVVLSDNSEETGGEP